MLHDLMNAEARISELEDTIDLTAAEDRVASSYGRSTYDVDVVNEIVARRGSEWTGAKTTRALAVAQGAEHAEHVNDTPGAYARLVHALGYASAWPVTDVLRRLATAARHLLEAHDCDRLGWEEVSSCASHADEIAAAIEAALAASFATTKGAALQPQFAAAVAIAREEHVREGRLPPDPPAPGLAEQLCDLLAVAGLRPWFHKPGCSMWKGTHVCDKGCGPPPEPEKKP